MTRDLGTINLSVPNIVLSRIKNKESHILLENLNRKKKEKPQAEEEKLTISNIDT